MSDWQDWLAAQRAAGTMSVENVPLRDVGGGWGMQGDAYHYGREDGNFFQVSGVKITNAGREVKSWGQPMLQETGTAGVVVLLRSAVDVNHFLVAARAEPGNPQEHCILLVPPLQASQANLEQVHGGTRPPRAELLDGQTVRWVSLPQDGARFFRKVNRYAIVKVDPAQIALNPNERWFTRAEIAEAFLAGECNEHLTQVFMIAVLG